MKKYSIMIIALVSSSQLYAINIIQSRALNAAIVQSNFSSFNEKFQHCDTKNENERKKMLAIAQKTVKQRENDLKNAIALQDDIMKSEEIVIKKNDKLILQLSLLAILLGCVNLSIFPLCKHFLFMRDASIFEILFIYTPRLLVALSVVNIVIFLAVVAIAIENFFILFAASTFYNLISSLRISTIPVLSIISMIAGTIGVGAVSRKHYLRNKPKEQPNLPHLRKLYEDAIAIEQALTTA